MAQEAEAQSATAELLEAQPDFIRRWWGGTPGDDRLARWLFLRALGGIYFVAFVSFGLQAPGLIGSNGILPAATFLRQVRQILALRAYWAVPSLFWLGSSDTWLRLLPLVGALAALALLVGFSHWLLQAFLFVAYLSVVSVGQDFMAFQWDILLLEAGFLAIFLGVASRLVPWLYRWLLFRLMFLSGAVKLLSGDPTWRNLTALDYHFETQPLPTVLGWFMAQLPSWFHRASTGGVFVIELGAPFLIFAPRRLRLAGCALIVFLQALIFATGNYTFFNLLTIGLCLFLLDDELLGTVFPKRLAERITSAPAPQGDSAFGPGAVAGLAALILLVSGVQLSGTFLRVVPQPLGALARAVSPFHIVNSYGLFAVMTTSRPEIIVEGSNDGQTWLEYGFKYKAGDVQRAPGWVEPFQPRLDWQMWFAALGTYQGNPWFVNFAVRLLQGSPQVLALLDKNPFPDAPPRYVRALLYDYHFTDPDTLRAGGGWWRRDLQGVYLPMISLEDVTGG
jgi:Lipase maturation factor